MMLVLAQAADSSYLMWGVLLLGVAVILLGVELFVPSGGLIGALAGIGVIGSVVAFYKYDPMWGMASLGLYVLLAPFVVYFMFKFWLSSPIAKRMILGGTDEGGLDDNSEETSVASEMARAERLAELRQLIGTEGMTITELRPVGTVRIGDQRVDALSESGLIEQNTPIIVTDVYDNQIKVRPK